MIEPTLLFTLLICTKLALFSNVKLPLTVTSFVMVKVTPDGTIATTPLLIVKAQATKSTVKGELGVTEAIVAFIEAFGGTPLLQLLPFQML
jgi:hypothetical protein